MAALRILLFGKFEILNGDEAVPGCEARKAQELLCFLLLNRDHAHARETLASMLWEDKPTAQARKYLRQTLWQLQSFLEAAVRPFENGRMLTVDDDWVSLNASAQIRVDAEDFEEAHRLTQGIAGRDLAAEQAASLCDAVKLYRGDLLEGWYRDWCLFERERLQNMYLEMLDKLVDCCTVKQEYTVGLGYAEQILRHDRARERTHRRMMRLYYLAGDRTGALRQYERCVAALAEELNVRPARSTNLLAEQIRRDQLVVSGGAAPNVVEPKPEPSSMVLGEVLQRLKQVQNVLAAAHQQVQRDIQTVENMLQDTR